MIIPAGSLPSGLSVLMTTWMASLRRYCLALTGDVDAADDVVQETFLEVQKAYDLGEGKDA